MPPGDPDDCVHNIETGPDLDVHVVSEQEWFARRHVLQCPVPRGSDLDRAERDRLHARLGADPALVYSVVAAWSVSAVTAALDSWIAGVLRRPDLRFSWDSGAGPSVMGRHVAHRADAARERSSYESGIPGVRIGDGAMDTLLAMPVVDAAAMMKSIRDLTFHHDDQSR